MVKFLDELVKKKIIFSQNPSEFTSTDWLLIRSELQNGGVQQLLWIILPFKIVIYTFSQSVTLWVQFFTYWLGA